MGSILNFKKFSGNIYKFFFVYEYISFLGREKINLIFGIMCFFILL